MDQQTLHELVTTACILHPNQVAIIEDDGSCRRNMMYSDLKNASDLIAETIGSIITETSHTSQFIAVCMDQCLQYPAIVLGILQKGFGFACIDPEWTHTEQMDFVKQLSVALIIHSDQDRESTTDVQRCKVTIMGSPFYFEKISQCTPVRKCSHSMAYAVLTSGSTGKSKLVRVPHSSIVPNILSLVQVLDVSTKDVIFLSSPPTFDPSIVDMFLALSTGAALLITSRSVKSSPSSLLRVLFPSEYSAGVSVLQMTPSLFNRWSESELRGIVFGPRTTLRALILGGEPFPCLSKFQCCEGPNIKTNVYNIYGITEVSSWASINQVIPLSNHSFTCLEDNHMPLGHLLSDTLFQVQDYTNSSIIRSGSGELLIGSSKRICEIDDENCLDFCLPVYRASGDVVKIHPDGKICYTGRKDNTVKRWGHRVNLESIEHIAMRYPGIFRSCCIWDEAKRKLYLMVNTDNETSLLGLQQHILRCVGSNKALIPDEILRSQDFSLTQHGKLNRKVLLEILDSKDLSHFKDSAGATFLELCGKVLGIQLINDGSFMDLGGNSILAVMLLSKLESIFGGVPQNLASLLLSEQSLQSISETFNSFYKEQISSNTVESEYSAESFRPQTAETTALISYSDSNKVSSQNSDKLISFSVRGKYSNDEFPCFQISGTTLEGVKMNMSWKQDLEKCIDASPLCLEYESGITGIVIGSHSGALVFLDGTTGQARWSVTLPHRVESSACPSKCGKYVYVGCYDGALYCICTISGKIIWSFRCKGMVKCTPVLCNEGRSVIFGSYDYHVYCVKAESGHLEWSSSFGDRGSWIASALVINNIGILCSLASKAYAVETINGQVLWSVSFQQPIFSTPCCFSSSSDTYVVVAEVKGTVHCLKLSSGEKVSHWQAPSHIFAPVIALSQPTSCSDDQHQILVPCYDQHLYSVTVDQFSAMSLGWKTDLGESVGCAPFPFAIKTSDNVKRLCSAVVNTAGKVFIICLRGGTVCCDFDVHSEVFSSPVVSNGRLYFGCRDNNIYSLEIK